MEFGFRVFALVLVILVLPSCGGGSGGGTGGVIIEPLSESQSNAASFSTSPGGIWVSQSAPSEPVSTLYIDENGRLILEQNSISSGFIAPPISFLTPPEDFEPVIIEPIEIDDFLLEGLDLDGLLNLGTPVLEPFWRFGAGQVALSSNNSFAAEYSESEILFGQPIPSPDISSCEISGTLVERASLNISLNCTDDTGQTRSESINFLPLENCAQGAVCNANYNQPSSLDYIAGTYSFLVPGLETSMEISTLGIVSGELYFGVSCGISGAVSIIDPQFNLYDIELTLSDCDSALSFQNGRTLRGFASLDGTSPQLSNGLRLVATVSGLELPNVFSALLFRSQ